MVRITALHVYPVKSCRGISLAQARITATGFEHDREWLVVRPNGQFVTQREEPRLALIETALAADALQLRTPQGECVSVPLNAHGPQLEVTCWRDRCAAFDMGEPAAALLSGFLDQPLRLVRFDPRGKRRSNPAWTQSVEALNQFSDGYAWLLLSQASLDDLNCRLAAPLPMNRFRPNIVVEGLPPYGEDDVHEFSAADVRLRAVKPCTRCIVTTTDQQAGTRAGDEPLRTLRLYRFSREPKGVVFGQNLILIDGVGRQLEVGQTLATAGKPMSA